MKGLAQLCRCACTITCRKPYIYPDLPNVPPRKTLIADLFLKFLLDRGSFCGATGTLCFGLQMTLLPMGKVRVDQSLPVLFCHLHAMIPRVISGCQDRAPNLDRSPRRRA